MTMIVIMLGILIIVAATSLGIIAVAASAVRALATFNPTVKVVQEYSVVGDAFSDIYDDKGELKEADKDEIPNLDDVLKSVNELFADDEVISDG